MLSFAPAFLRLMVESDPTYQSPHTPGAKLDAGKPDCDLVFSGFSKALLEVAKVGTFGAAKYTENGWKSVPDGVRRYRSAIYRHLLASEFRDDESSLPHLAHAAWNCLATLEFLLTAEPVAQEHALEATAGPLEATTDEGIPKPPRNYADALGPVRARITQEWLNRAA